MEMLNETTGYSKKRMKSVYKALNATSDENTSAQSDFETKILAAGNLQIVLDNPTDSKDARVSGLETLEPARGRVRKRVFREVMVISLLTTAERGAMDLPWSLVECPAMVVALLFIDYKQLNR